jgi:hypothetical protein
MADAANGSGGKRSARKFFQRAASKREDEKKTRVTLRLPVSLAARIQAITLEGIATKRFKWRTYTETYEAMILRGLQTFKDDAFIGEQIPHLNLVEHFAGIANSRSEATASLALAKREITELLKIDALSEALQYYHTTKTAAESMPPTIWRDWLLKQLVAAFPDLDKRIAPGITLVHSRRSSQTSQTHAKHQRKPA